jgi:hypothetical protein
MTIVVPVQTISKTCQQHQVMGIISAIMGRSAIHHPKVILLSFFYLKRLQRFTNADEACTGVLRGCSSDTAAVVAFRSLYGNTPLTTNSCYPPVPGAGGVTSVQVNCLDCIKCIHILCVHLHCGYDIV